MVLLSGYSNTENIMRIMCRRNCIKYIFTLLAMCFVASLYIAVLRHNSDIHNRFHVKRLKVKRDLHSKSYANKLNAADMTPIKEPPHVDRYNSTFKGAGDETVHVHIVEEHHEVIPYWFGAARRNIIPRSGNTLVHIDGHMDLAPPLYVPGYPAFTFPLERELKYLMQTNDAFIQASAMAGLVNRLIWVWPEWDAKNHDSNYFMSTISLGMIASRKGSNSLKGFCACIKNETQFECMTLTNISKLVKKSSDDHDEYSIPRHLCKIKKILIVEEIHETKALNFFRKSDWIAKSENIILDIDEDYYGCSYAIDPLLKANLSYNRINRLDNLIASHICPKTFTHEKESDKFLMGLLATTRTKRACKIDDKLKNSEKCSDVAKIDIHKHFKQQLDRSVTDNLIHMCFHKSSDSFVQNLMSKLSTFSIKQIRALQKTGFCSRTTPKTFQMDGSGFRFGICIGSNTPKETAVLEHTPSKPEIATRSILLKGLIKELSNHSVDLVTVCRSVRDGYTPRQFFERIETDVLNGLNVSLKRKISLHYDRELLGGKPGWPARHKV